MVSPAEPWNTNASSSVSTPTTTVLTVCWSAPKTLSICALNCCVAWSAFPVSQSNPAQQRRGFPREKCYVARMSTRWPLFTARSAEDTTISPR